MLTKEEFIITKKIKSIANSNHNNERLILSKYETELLNKYIEKIQKANKFSEDLIDDIQTKIIKYFNK